MVTLKKNKATCKPDYYDVYHVIKNNHDLVDYVILKHYLKTSYHPFWVIWTDLMDSRAKELGCYNESGCYFFYTRDEAIKFLNKFTKKL